MGDIRKGVKTHQLYPRSHDAIGTGDSPAMPPSCAPLQSLLMHLIPPSTFTSLTFRHLQNYLYLWQACADFKRHRRRSRWAGFGKVYPQLFVGPTLSRWEEINQSCSSRTVFSLGTGARLVPTRKQLLAVETEESGDGFFTFANEPAAVRCSSWL